MLSVLCGSITIFTMNIELNISEKEGFTEFGESFIDDLAEKVKAAPNDFQNRHGDMSSLT